MEIECFDTRHFSQPSVTVNVRHAIAPKRTFSTGSSLVSFGEFTTSLYDYHKVIQSFPLDHVRTVKLAKRIHFPFLDPHINFIHKAPFNGIV